MALHPEAMGTQIDRCLIFNAQSTTGQIERERGKGYTDRDV